MLTFAMQDRSTHESAGPHAGPHAGAGARVVPRSLPDAVIVLDDRHRVVAWSDSAEHLLARPAADAVGRDVDALLQPRDVHGNPTTMGPADPRRVLRITTGTPEQEILVRTGRNQDRWIGTYSALQRGQKGAVERVIVVARDNTRRRRVEVAKSEAVSAVSHELRSPLTSVKGFTSTLLRRWDRFDDDTKKQLLTTIENDADRVTRLIGELLDLSRIESGGLELHRYVIELPDVAEKVTTRISHTTDAHTLTVDFPLDFPAVYADPDKIEQVITNLVENAVKYTDGGRIVVSGVIQDRTVRVSVADQGPGIPEEQRLTIFGKYFRREGHPGAPSGTGLGLYISKGLVEAHGGRIWADQAATGGSVFVFTLPVIEPAEP